MQTLKLKIEPTGHFFKIHLFDTANEMREYYDEFCRKTGQEAGPMDFSAITMPCEMYKGDMLLDQIGDILFSKQNLGVGVIVHELGHAAFHYDRVVNQNKKAKYGEWCGEEEERYLYTLTQMVADLVRHFHEINAFE